MIVEAPYFKMDHKSLDHVHWINFPLLLKLLEYQKIFSWGHFHFHQNIDLYVVFPIPTRVNSVSVSHRFFHVAWNWRSGSCNPIKPVVRLGRIIWISDKLTYVRTYSGIRPPVIYHNAKDYPEIVIFLDDSNCLSYSLKFVKGNKEAAKLTLSILYVNEEECIGVDK